MKLHWPASRWSFFPQFLGVKNPIGVNLGVKAFFEMQELNFS